MQVKIVSAKDAANNIDFIVRNNLNLVSIRDTRPDASLKVCYDAIDRSGIQNIYRITFDDLEYDLDPKYQKAEVPPSPQDIRGILEWAKEKMVSNPSGFVVHCTAGVSRSSAVAVLIKCLQDPENALKVLNPLLHSPNMRIIEFGEKILEGIQVKDKIREIEDASRDMFLSEYDMRIDQDKFLKEYNKNKQNGTP